jgi:hypothetical protein
LGESYPDIEKSGMGREGFVALRGFRSKSYIPVSLPYSARLLFYNRFRGVWGRFGSPVD